MIAKPTNALSVVAVLLLLIGSAFATQYIVGDDSGWNTEVDYYAWLEGKTFYVGDVLVFSYVKTDHNVAMVDANGYNNCNADSNYGLYDTGYDTFTLTTPGDVYFICTYHCDYTDQKLKVTILPSP
ncbi:stellacyanin-like [Punica granatum]|uniref:Stellacyanin-like n=1 Tax=Punica granatum TaxID=22663 RepID=A0A6P8CUQ0_PUNGR|nr:stellacyanin-like [Punica granatum]